MQRLNKNQTLELTLDFGPSIKNVLNQISPFKRVQSQMLKKRQKIGLRRKPMQYQKLQASIKERIKQKYLSQEEQNEQMRMLEKCQNFLHLKNNHSYVSTPKRSSLSNHRVRDHTAKKSTVFYQKLKDLMKNCDKQNSLEDQAKQNLQVFIYYCKIMDKKMEKMKSSIQKKERMI